MPFVRISHRAGVSEAYRQALSDGVQEAMEQTVNDRFHIVTEHAAGLIFDAHYLGIERSPDWVAIQITLRKGRTVAMKQALYRRIVANLAAAPGLRPEDVLICLLENDLADWSFGGGVAQYVQ